jgi:hypothetical protein
MAIRRAAGVRRKVRTRSASQEGLSKLTDMIERPAAGGKRLYGGIVIGR